MWGHLLLLFYENSIRKIIGLIIFHTFFEQISTLPHFSNVRNLFGKRKILSNIKALKGNPASDFKLAHFFHYLLRKRNTHIIYHKEICYEKDIINDSDCTWFRNKRKCNYR